MKEIFQADDVKTLLEIDEQEFLDLNLILASDIVIWVNKWHWPQDDSSQWQMNLSTEPDRYPVLLRSTSQGVIETPLTLFSYTTIAAFQQANRVAWAIHDIVNQIDLTMDREHEAAVKACLIGQIKEALAGGVLAVHHVPAEARP